MTVLAFRGFSIAEPGMPPAKRLDWALDLARDYFGPEVPPTVYVHTLTAAETPPRDGIALVVRDEVGRFGYWFPDADQHDISEQPA